MRHNRVCSDNRSVADMNARKNRHVLTYPDIVADNRVAFQRQLVQSGRNLLPSVAEYVERICRESIHAMVRAVHNKFHAFAYRAELTYNEFVAYKLITVRNVFFKLLRTVFIAVSGLSGFTSKK